ncbi:M48 family metallopeptidase [Frateuria aurantia]
MDTQAAAMLYSMTTDGEIIEVRPLAHPRSRRLRLTVTGSGARLSYPPGTRGSEIQGFLATHADWLQLKLKELQVPAVSLPSPQIGVATDIMVRGRRLPLDWESTRFPRVELRDERLWLGLPEQQRQPWRVARGLLASFFEAQLRRDVARDLGFYTARLGRAPAALRVRRLKSLWGSLDTRDRVNLDLSLAMAPPEALRYVLVHELCHLRVRNHSPRFWAEVSALLPQWREQRAWLKQHGARMKAEMDRWVAGPPE